MGCFWQPVFRAIGNFFRQNWRAILNITVTGLCHLASGPNPGCAALGSFVSGITSGNLGQALKGAAIAFFTAAAFDAVGTATLGVGHKMPDFLSPAHLSNMAGHALVGCVSAVAQGGRCGPGALSAAAGSFAGPILRDLGFHRNLVAHAVVGGIASVAAGGNFANGAITSAYGYLFNELGDQNDRHKEGMDKARRDLEAQGFTVGPGQAVTVEGLEEYRVYDLMARNKATGQLIGIEVKTTIGEIIFLDEAQVRIDAIVATRGGWTTLDQRVSGVSYYTYCYSCPAGIPELQNALLLFRLQFSGVKVIPGKLGR
jgi:hypothetical protein